ncbi:MAG TPA: hypothetical protein DEV81_16825 [Cyanobacteria bacterium UBA11049]|nr:hypothetical protein [Cyanobacteria bacterium UBA11049]
MQLNQGFIIDSYHFYNIAKESYYKAQQGFTIHRQNDALVAIIFAALSLEAFINELGHLATEAKASGHEEDFLNGLINAIEESQESKKKSTLDKFMMASVALSNKFDKGKHPYQDFADLFKLRDCLVHLKPQDRLTIDEDSNWFYSGRKLIDRLRSKGIFQEHTQIKSITLLVSTAKAAKWACDTVSAMVSAILDSIPNSEFSKDNQVIALYKNMFQPLEAEAQQKLEEQQHNRQIAVAQADEVRTRLLKTYGEFPDSVELLYEDS